jgi:hypothetical protein
MFRLIFQFICRFSHDLFLPLLLLVDVLELFHQFGGIHNQTALVESHV